MINIAGCMVTLIPSCLLKNYFLSIYSASKGEEGVYQEEVLK